MRPAISSLTALLVAVSINSIDSFTAIPSCNNLPTKSTSVTSNSNSRLMGRKKKVEETNDTAPAINPAKKAALDGVLQRIERNYGRGSIVKLGKYEYVICTFYFELKIYTSSHAFNMICIVIIILGDADRMVVDCIGSGSMTLGE